MKNITIAGWSQITKKNIIPNSTPTSIMEEAVVSACQKTKNNNIMKEIEGIMIIMPLSINIPDAANNLAKKLKIKPDFTFNSGIGGHSSQFLINIAAGMIARGDLDTILIAGAETFYSKEKKSSLFQGVPKKYCNEDIIGTTELEKYYGISMPLDGFPLFETALWKNSGLSLKDYLYNMGKLISSFSLVASKHPNAWFNKERSIESIVSPSRKNPEVSFPYTKLMCPNPYVNMGAAIIISADKKNNKNNKVYFTGGGYSQDRQRFIIEKNDFTSSIPLKNAVSKALIRSNMTIDDVECFDFYSCFPCAVFIAKKMLGIKEDDNRPITLTGGLSCFGGPGSNYSLHSVVTLVEMISNGFVKNGMITALSWFMYKHAVGIYSSKPSNRNLKNDHLEDEVNFLSGNPPVKSISNFTGKGTIETYTIHSYKNNIKETAVIYGRTKNEQLRFVGLVEDKSIISEIISNNYVGKLVKVFNKNNTNIVTL